MKEKRQKKQKTNSLQLSLPNYNEIVLIQRFFQQMGHLSMLTKIAVLRRASTPIKLDSGFHDFFY